MISLFKNTKSFDDRWIGHPGLVQAGSHICRLRAAKAALKIRQLSTAFLVQSLTKDQRNFFTANGFLAIPNFLQTDLFNRLQQEIYDAVAKAEAITPLTFGDQAGYQDRINRPFGFDRYDGSTLNRFIPIRERADDLVYCQHFLQDPRLDALNRLGMGRRQNKNHVWIYQLLQGPEDEQLNDPQKILHRDTFFSALKFWYFIDPVTPKDGPFEFVAGSHRLTTERLLWEQSRALMATQQEEAPDPETWAFARGGSFRASEDDLNKMALPAPTALTVDANTMVIADTFGFHRRGQAIAGRKRLSLYGNNRPWAFLPIGY